MLFVKVVPCQLSNPQNMNKCDYKNEKINREGEREREREREIEQQGKTFKARLDQNTYSNFAFPYNVASILSTIT